MDDGVRHPVVAFGFGNRPRRLHFPEQWLGPRGRLRAKQRGNLTDAVGVVVVRQVRSRHFAECRQQVEWGDQGRLVDFAGFDLPRPTGDEGDAHAAFKQCRLVSFATAGDAFGRTDPPSRSGRCVVIQSQLCRTGRSSRESAPSSPPCGLANKLRWQR